MGLCLVVAAPTRANATYSILAVDREAGTVGGAVASCVPLDVLDRVYGAVPARGGLMTQSYLYDPAHGAGLELLGEGASPDEVLAGLVDPVFDPDFQLRQYAVVDLEGRVAAFTGAQALPHASHLVIEHASFVGSVQGNLLTGRDVALAARDAFVDDGACDLAERLVRALEAGGAGGRGDARCVSTGTPAKSAIVEVDDPSGPILRIAIEAPGDPPVESPLVRVRDELETWRAEHACPSVATSTAASTSSGAPSAPGEAGHGCATHAGPASSDGRGDGAALVSAAVAVAAGARRRRARRARSSVARAIDFRGPS